MAIGDKLFIADKVTLDSVKQDTQIIKSNFPLSLPNGIDNYIPFADVIYKVADTTSVGAKITLKEIIGEGYITEAMLATSISPSGYFQLTLDNEIVVKSGCTASNLYYGLFHMPNIRYVGASTSPYVLASFSQSSFTNCQVDTTNVAQFYKDLSNSPSTQKSLFLNEPLFFKQKCLIEFISASSSSRDIKVNVRGGIKII